MIGGRELIVMCDSEDTGVSSAHHSLFSVST